MTTQWILRMRNISDKRLKKIKKKKLCSITPHEVLPFMKLGENMGQPDRPQMTI